MKKIESALRLASEGFYVFPVVPDGKIPAVKNWPNKATREQTTIDMWWRSNPDFNVGIFTGRYGDDEHLIAVDVDVKDGKNGMAAWKQFKDELKLPVTRRNKTPTGGLHYIYASPHPVKSSAGKLAEGLDIRSAGGFILGPGSTIEGKPYRTNEVRVEEAPSSLIDKCGVRMDPIVNECELENLDTPGIVESALSWLRDGAPKAIEGRGGDDTTFKVALHLKDLGLSQLLAVDFMADHWNDTKADPPWEFDALAQKVGNAYRYGANSVGARSAHADFERVEVPEELKKPKPKRNRLYWIKASDIEVDLDRVDLVQGLLTEKAMSIMYGEPGSGKTFLTLKLGYCIATGRPFANRRVQQGAVVYIAAEAATSIMPRIEALKIHHDNHSFPMGIVPCPINLLDDNADTDDLIRIIEESGQVFGMKVQFVVIDTLSRAMPGGNENSPDDMTAFVGNVDKIRNAVDAHICVVHHLGKDKARGARGHSSLTAATDSAFEVANDQLKTTKQRDREHSPPIAFELVTHGIGTNAYDEEVTSCVLQEIDAPAEEDFEDTKITDRQKAAIEVLGELAKAKNPVEIAAWRSQMRSTSPFQKLENDRSYLTAAKRLREFLVDRGVASYDEEKQLLTWLVDMGVDTENE